jgi:hypothetical protein
VESNSIDVGISGAARIEFDSAPELSKRFVGSLQAVERQSENMVQPGILR